MRLSEFNALSTDEAVKDLLRCCGSRRWAMLMAAGRPYTSFEAVMRMADECWAKLDREDYLEAFRQHPNINDVASARAKCAAIASRSSGGPSDVQSASEEVLRRLAEGNQRYEKRFGFNFIVCATGKTAEELLALLERRLRNRPHVEFNVAASEQAKITRIRLGKLFHEEAPIVEP